MIIASFDIATQCGIAVGKSGGDPLCWSEDLGKGKPHSLRFSNALALVHRVIRDYSVDLVSVEAPIGGRTKSEVLIGLYACVIGCARNHKKPCFKYQISPIRSSFCGRVLHKKDFPGKNDDQRTKALKAEVVRNCNLRGWNVPDHDAADAAALWEYSCAKAGFDIKTGGMFL